MVMSSRLPLRHRANAAPSGFDQFRLELWLRDSYCTRALTSPKQTEAVHRAPTALEERTDPNPERIRQNMVAAIWLTDATKNLPHCVRPDAGSLTVW